MVSERTTTCDIASCGMSTVTHLLEAGAACCPAAPALRWMDGRTLSHDALRQAVAAAGERLAALGVGRTTRVMTAMPDGPLAAMVLLSLTSHAVCAPINPDLRGSEVDLLIPELKPDLLVANGVEAEAARQAAGRAHLPVLEVSLDADGKLIWQGPSVAEPVAASLAEPDDPALVLLTSGSSARPKRVPLTHRHLTLAAERMARSLALSPDDLCLNMMPMFHVGAVVDLLLAPLLAGGSVLRPETMSVPVFFEALERHRPTWFQGVPTLLHEVAAQAARRLGTVQRTSLRLVRSVSSPLPADWLAQIESALSAPVIEIYGMTETAGLITSNPLPPGVRKLGSVGIPTGLEVKVEAAAGGRGEILVRGAGVMTGYERLEAADSGMTEDGWLRTGDEGCFDEDGYLYITGRITDQINRGGEKVSPREVDEALLSHPAILDAAAFPLPHPKLGHEVAAALVLHPGTTVEPAELTAHVSARLAHFKVPKTCYVVEALPRGPGGKLRRRLLPEQVAKLTPLVADSAEGEEGAWTLREREVADWWARELNVTGVSRHSDFFDLGGDSLAAVGFTVGVEKALGIQVKPAALFDHPTVASFAAYLDEALAQGPAAQVVSGVLRPELMRKLQAAMGVWPGARPSGSALFVAIRTAAAGIPVFWCGQGRNEFEATAASWPVEHPFYATRSLFLFEGKTKADERALAEGFAGEVEKLRAGREVVLGGFCAGGRIAMEAARLLRESGVPVRLVFAHESWATTALDVPVVLSFCVDSVFSPRRRFSRPEAAMNKRFTGGWNSWEIPTTHIGLFEDAALMADTTRAIVAVLSGAVTLPKPPPMQEVPPQACRAKLAGKIPRTLRPCETRLITVSVKNDSQRDWPAAKVSGLHLGGRWLDENGSQVGDPVASVPLPEDLPSKSSLTLRLPVTVPESAGRLTLELDMVDEGLRWFSERRNTSKPSPPLRAVIHITPRPWFKLFPSLHSISS